MERMKKVLIWIACEAGWIAGFFAQYVVFKTNAPYGSAVSPNLNADFVLNYEEAPALSVVCNSRTFENDSKMHPRILSSEAGCRICKTCRNSINK